MEYNNFIMNIPDIEVDIYPTQNSHEIILTNLQRDVF